LTGDAIEVAAGQGALSKLLLFPIVLIAAFAVLYFLRKRIIATANPIAEEV
jgi:hypothetical protein